MKHNRAAYLLVQAKRLLVGVAFHVSLWHRESQVPPLGEVFIFLLFSNFYLLFLSASPELIASEQVLALVLLPTVFRHIAIRLVGQRLPCRSLGGSIQTQMCGKGAWGLECRGVEGTLLSFRAGVSHWLSKISAKWRRCPVPIEIEELSQVQWPYHFISHRGFGN